MSTTGPRGKVNGMVDLARRTADSEMSEYFTREKNG